MADGCEAVYISEFRGCCIFNHLTIDNQLRSTSQHVIFGPQFWQMGIITETGDKMGGDKGGFKVRTMLVSHYLEHRTCGSMHMKRQLTYGDAGNDSIDLQLFCLSRSCSKDPTPSHKVLSSTWSSKTPCIQNLYQGFREDNKHRAPSNAMKIMPLKNHHHQSF